MSKIGKIFKTAFDVTTLGVFKGKKSKNKAVFQAIAAKSAKDKAAGKLAKQGSEAESAQRRERTAARLRSGRVTSLLTRQEDEENAITRPGARRAKLLGN